MSVPSEAAWVGAAPAGGPDLDAEEARWRAAQSAGAAG
jgi:hypothetical protein